MPKWAMLWPWVRKKVSLWPADSWPADGSVLVLNYCQPCNAIEQLSRTATRLAGIAVNAGQGLIVMGLVGQWVHWMVITCHVWQLLCPKWWSLRMSILFAMVWPKLYSTICPHDVMCNDWPGWPPWSQEPYWVILFYYIIIIIMLLSTLTHMISPSTHSEHTVKHQSCRATSPLAPPAHTNLTCTSWAQPVFAAAKITVWQSCADFQGCTDGFGCGIASCCPLDWGGCHHWTLTRLAAHLKNPRIWLKITQGEPSDPARLNKILL